MMLTNVAVGMMVYCMAAAATSDIRQIEHQYLPYGESVTFPCKSASNVDVRWTQTDSSSHVYKIYINGSIYSGIRNRFSIQSTELGEHNLAMKRANPSDAGLYVCDELNPVDGSRNVLRRFHLSVDERSDDEHISVLAYIGTEVQMNCSYSAEIGTGVDWRYQQHRGPSSTPVYQSGYLQYGFQDGRFASRKHSPQLYSLTVSNVTVSDSGIYLCIEERGQGRVHYFELNVTEFVETDTTESSLLTTEADDVVPTTNNTVIIVIVVTANIVIILLAIFVVFFLWRVRARSKSTATPNSEEQKTLLDALPGHYAEPPSLLGDLPTSAGVWGLAVLNKTLYVVVHKSNVIRKFRADPPFEPCGELTIPELGWPTDMLADERKGCLYVGDRYGRKTSNGPDLPALFAVTPSGNFRGINPDDAASEIHMRHFLDATPAGLSMTREHHVLVVCEEQKMSRSLRFFQSERTNDGNIELAEIRRIKVESERFLLQAVPVGGSRFVISQVHKGDVNRIIVVNDSGRQLSEFGGSESPSNHKLSFPWSLYFDSRHQVIIANDCDHRRLILLKFGKDDDDADAQLRYCGDLISEKRCKIPESFYPRRLCVVNDSRIYVGSGYGTANLKPPVQSHGPTVGSISVWQLGNWNS